MVDYQCIYMTEFTFVQSDHSTVFSVFMYVLNILRKNLGPR